MNLRNLTYKLDKIRNEIGLIYNDFFIYLILFRFILLVLFYFDENHSLIIELNWGVEEINKLMLKIMKRKKDRSKNLMNK